MERRGRAVVAREAARGREVLDRRALDHVDADADAGVEATVRILAQRVDLVARQPRRMGEMADHVQPTVVAKAGDTETLGIRHAELSGGALDEIRRASRREPVGACQPTPRLAFSDRETFGARRPQPALAIDQELTVDLVLAPTGDPFAHPRWRVGLGHPQQSALTERDPERPRLIGQREQLSPAELLWWPEVHARAGGRVQAQELGVGRVEHVLRGLDQRADRVVLGLRECGPGGLTGRRVDDAAIRSEPQRTVARAHDRPHRIRGKREPRVRAPQTAAEQLIELVRDQPQRALAVLEHAEDRSRRHTARGAQQLPPRGTGPVREPAARRHPQGARAIDQHAPHLAGVGELGRHVVASQERVVTRPQEQGRAQPRGAVRGPRDRLDRLAPEPVVLVVLDPATSRGQDDRILAASGDDRAVRADPHRRARPAGPARSEWEAAGLLVQQAARARDPERAGGIECERVDRELRIPDRYADRRDPPTSEPRDAPGRTYPQPIRGRQQRGDVVARQSLGETEALEPIAIVAIEAVLGGDPEQPIRGLGDLVDREVVEATLDPEAPERGAGDWIRMRGRDRDKDPEHRPSHGLNVGQNAS